MMIKVIVSGACGRMSSRIIVNVIAQPDMKLTGALEREGHPGLGKDVGEVLHIDSTGIKLSKDSEEAIKNGDVLVEFSNPETSLEHLRIAAKNKNLPSAEPCFSGVTSMVCQNKKSVILGTTGFSNIQVEEIKKIAKDIPCVLSPNMSVGVNLLFRIVREVAPTLKDYDIEIVEMHHNLKKDAPSGTALKLAQIIAEVLGIDLEEIGIHSVRGGDVAGDHTVIFAGQGERIELTHRASNRDAFALGAIKAIRFVANAKPGLYDMEKVLEG